MALDQFEKQSSEKFVISGSFSNDLDAGENIDSGASSVTASDKNGQDVSSTVLNAATKTVDGSKILIQVQGGDESLSPYKITFKAVTDATPPNEWELDIRMKIKEK